jgi:hypothetical protein
MGWADSMEFGALERRPNPHPDNPTQDVDTSATWRALGAWIWEAPCLPDHIGEIADDTILTTHVLAAAMLSRNSVGMIEAAAFSEVGGNAAIAALDRGEGMEPAHDEVSQMSIDQRRRLIGECIALLLKGFTSLQLDLEGHYLR